MKKTFYLNRLFLYLHVLNIIKYFLVDEKEIENVFWEVEYFFQENSVEVLDILIHSNQVEIFEMMRIYVDRVKYFILNFFRMEDLLIILLIQRMIFRKRD